MFRAQSISSDSEYPHIEQFMRSIPESPIEVAQFNQNTVPKNKQSQFPIKKVVGFTKIKDRRTSMAKLLELPLPRTPSLTLNSSSKVNNELFPELSSVNENLMRSEDRSQTGSLFNGKFNSSLHHDRSMVLKQLIKKHKIKSIVKNFVSKIKRVSVLNVPVDHGQQDPYNKGLLYRHKGYSLPQVVQNAISILGIIQLLVFSFVFSISLVYSELKSSNTVFNLQLFSCVFLIFQVGVNLFTVKHSSGKKLQLLIDIWHFYAKGSLMIDLLSVLVLVISFVSGSDSFQYFKLIVLFKIPQYKEKMERLQGQFINNLYNEQYWSLIKILFFNFTFAHIISIILMAMTNLSEGNNWMSLKSIQYAPWYQKYSWSYYWANTIMLTVGFGDLVATNYKEAICLVFIQTFSCMAFAYNINCIGNIVQQITSKDAERSQKAKIFTKLNSKNNLSESLSWKINNYIEQTAQLRKNFNYEEEKAFITNLPAEMKRQYLKQSNKNIFQNINFFKNFVAKTLINLAQRIEMRVSHPQEIIQNLEADFNLTILKTGRFGFVYRRPNFEIKDVMDIVSVKEKGNPALVNLQFILRKRPFYQIKSLEYAIYYFLPYEKLIQVLKRSSMDYELFCVLRDRIKNIPDQFEVFKCELCSGKHLRALCPKLHYIPFQQTIIHRYLYNERTQINFRVDKDDCSPRQGKSKSPFVIYKKYVSNVELQKGNIVQCSHRNRRRQIEKEMNEKSKRDITQKQETEVEKEIKIINEKYKCITNQIIKEQINKLVRSDNCQDEIWMLKNDVLYDFNAYFPEQNPVNIEINYVESAQLFKSDKILKVNSKTKQLVMTSKNWGGKSQPPRVLRNTKRTKTTH